MWLSLLFSFFFIKNGTKYAYWAEFVKFQQWCRLKTAGKYLPLLRNEKSAFFYLLFLRSFLEITFLPSFANSNRLLFCFYYKMIFVAKQNYFTIFFIMFAFFKSRAEMETLIIVSSLSSAIKKILGLSF